MDKRDQKSSSTDINMKTGKCNALPWILVNIIVVISLANGKTRTKPVGQKVKDIDPDVSRYFNRN